MTLYAHYTHKWQDTLYFRIICYITNGYGVVYLKASCVRLELTITPINCYRNEDDSSFYIW
jgi:hypothetical protein